MSVAEIGIIGGSGFYSLLPRARELTVQTPYGPTSDVLSVGEIAGRKCVFLPRHGRRHALPPHVIPYRANIYAMKELGVTMVIACNAVGALSEEHSVGQFVFADQVVDFTHGRAGSFYDGPITTHIGFTEPYCPMMRQVGHEAALRLKLAHATSGTIVVIDGPRFSSAAESRFFGAQGWHLENMTQMPECALAREMTLSYLNISLVANSHLAALENHSELAEAPAVIDVLRERLPDLRRLVETIAELLPPGEERPQFIREALKQGRWV
jgi:5'-methylthioadenosine phosphorylase